MFENRLTKYFDFPDILITLCETQTPDNKEKNKSICLLKSCFHWLTTYQNILDHVRNEVIRQNVIYMKPENECEDK